MADGLAVGLVVGLAVDVVGVGVAVALTGGWDAEAVMPNAVAGAQFAALGAVGCGPGLRLAGTVPLGFFLAAVATAVW